SVYCMRITQLQAVWFSDRITQQSPPKPLTPRQRQIETKSMKQDQIISLYFIVNRVMEFRIY
ncbi:hypothetical protein, partial [Vibrio cholerae]|uniref:hypothetical protein n=1 Tax=Vibrio cholerae TaxID=666 RepID=UPI001CA35FEC